MGDVSNVHERIEAENQHLRKLLKESLDDPVSFWEEGAKILTWTKPWTTTCDVSDAPITKWFTGGELNMCYNCVDKHILEGDGEREAIIYDSPVTDTHRTYTYQETHDEVTRLAGFLKDSGVVKGDIVMICMPMIVEGVFSMLASCRLGAIHSAQPSGLPAHDLAMRIDHAKPKVVLIASHGFHANGWVNYKELLDEACEKATHKPDKVLVLNRREKVNMVSGRDVDWSTATKTARPMLECVSMESTEPLFVIYTSGSTGEPKAIVHAVGSYAVRLIVDAQALFGIDNNEVLFGTSSLGWIVGTSLTVYWPMMSKYRTVVYEGDPLMTTDVHALYRALQVNGITRAFVRAGILRVMRSMDTNGEIASQYKINVKQIYSGGEKMDTSTLEWCIKTFKTPVLNIYSQTEMAAQMSGQMDIFSAGRFRKITKPPAPGLDVVIVKPDNTEAQTNEVGRILIRLPLPPGGLISLLHDHEKCKTTYFGTYPGFYDTKDNGYLDDIGSLVIEGRADDIMKHASIYLSGTAVEEVVLSHKDVAECVVISIPDLILKGIPVTLYTVKPGNDRSLDIISKEILDLASNHFGVAVTFGKMIPVKELPVTRTGKIHRTVLAAMGKGLPVPSRGTVENPEVLDDVESDLKKAGYGRIED